MFHRVESSTLNAIEDNEVEKTNEISLAIDAEFDVADVNRELLHANYLLDSCNEDEKYCDFIKHLNKDAARNYLVALS